MTPFNQRGPEFASTLSRLFAHQGKLLEGTLLRQGKAAMEQTGYDNWNGGTDIYSFVVRLPVEHFARLGERQDDVEKAVYQQLQRLLRTETNVNVTEVAFVPDGAMTTDDDSTSAPEESHIWADEQFRLFISHASDVKAQAEALKGALTFHGIAGFVAHSDIEPTRDWQDVIQGALRTMDALVAIITPTFNASKWCDQEVGIAIGRNRLVIPVRAGADPYGFVARYQGIQGRGLPMTQLAGTLFEILAKNDRTSARLSEAVLALFRSANSFADAKRLMSVLEAFPNLPLRALREVEPALESNVDLREAFGVPIRFRALVARNGGAA